MSIGDERLHTRNLLVRSLHALAMRPDVYDGIQRLAGLRLVHDRLERRLLPRLTGTPLQVVDLGGGTGLFGARLPAEVPYLCGDLDPQKLAGMVRSGRRGEPVQLDATALPFPSATLSNLVCVSLLHHLAEESLQGMLAECQRVLKEGGTLFCLDPVWSPANLPGRLLWSLDRGSYPRTAERVAGAIGTYMTVVAVERFRLFHEYVLIEARRGGGDEG